MIKKSLLLAGVLAVTGCASIASGTTQQVTIISTPDGAICDVSRQGMMLQRAIIPTSPMIQKSKYDLSVQCSKTGYQNTILANKSGVEPWIFGNLIFGGLIGVLIDVSSGAQNHYDTLMSVALPLNPISAPIAADPLVSQKPIT